MDSNPNFKPFYYGHPNFGGPSILLNLGNSLIHSTIKLISSSISDYPYYISGDFLKNENDYKTIDRPPQMKEDFNDIKKYIRKSTKQKKIKSFNCNIYFMKNAFKEYETGEKRIK